MAFCWPMALVSRSPARIASVRIPSESLGTLASHWRQAGLPGRLRTRPRRVAGPVRGRLREAPGWRTRATRDPRADPLAGKPITTRWSASPARPRITAWLRADYVSGLHKRGDYQLWQGAAGVCPPDAVLDQTSIGLSPRTAEYQSAQGVPQSSASAPAGSSGTVWRNSNGASRLKASPGTARSGRGIRAGDFDRCEPHSAGGTLRG
jgi:hypothetical protein